MRNYKLYLEDIISAIERIEKSLSKVNEDDFKQDMDFIESTMMRLQIIGEAVKNLPDKLKKEGQIEWKKIAGLRDIITHAYFNLDKDIIWDIVKNKLPNLKKEILEILKKERKNLC